MDPLKVTADNAAIEKSNTYGQAVLQQTTKEVKAAADYTVSHPEERDRLNPVITQDDPRSYRWLFSGQPWDPRYFRKDHPTLSDEAITDLYKSHLYENASYDPKYASLNHP